jgi:hypothetical protein
VVARFGYYTRDGDQAKIMEETVTIAALDSDALAQRQSRLKYQ